MIKLKQVVQNADLSIEATWVEEVTPAIYVPESKEPDIEYPDVSMGGYLYKGGVKIGAIIPAHTIPAEEKFVECHTFMLDTAQMDELEFRLGDFAKEYAEFIAEARAVIAAYVPPPEVLAPVTPRQIRQALTRADLRARVEDAVKAGDQDLKDWWEFSLSFERENAQVIAMSVVLKIDSDQVDDLWRLAITL